MSDHYRQTGDPELDRILEGRYRARNARIAARRERALQRRIATLETQFEAS